jgi:hypothetical protein
MSNHGWGRSIQGEERRASKGEKRLQKRIETCLRYNEELNERNKLKALESSDGDESTEMQRM